jgi:Uma2 family endonuclease
MSTLQAVPKHTYDDLARLPEGTLCQLINGHLIMAAAPIPYHQKFVMRIAIALEQFAEEHDAGEVFVSPIDVYFEKHEVYQPDIVFIAKERLSVIGEKKIEAAPDLVVEVLSESNAYYDLRHKKHIYEQFGVGEYWIVDAVDDYGKIEILTNTNGTFRITSEAYLSETITSAQVESTLLKGFTISLESVFAPYRG